MGRFRSPDHATVRRRAIEVGTTNRTYLRDSRPLSRRRRGCDARPREQLPIVAHGAARLRDLARVAHERGVSSDDIVSGACGRYSFRAVASRCIHILRRARTRLFSAYLPSVRGGIIVGRAEADRSAATAPAGTGCEGKPQSGPARTLLHYLPASGGVTPCLAEMRCRCPKSSAAQTWAIPRPCSV